jgi:hypothetical protein
MGGTGSALKSRLSAAVAGVQPHAVAELSGMAEDDLDVGCYRRRV